MDELMAPAMAPIDAQGQPMTKWRVDLPAGLDAPEEATELLQRLADEEITPEILTKFSKVFEAAEPDSPALRALRAYFGGYLVILARSPRRDLLQIGMLIGKLHEDLLGHKMTPQAGRKKGARITNAPRHMEKLALQKAAQALDPGAKLTTWSARAEQVKRMCADKRKKGKATEHEAILAGQSTKNIIRHLQAAGKSDTR